MTKNFARTALGGLVSAICLIASAVDGQQIIYVNQAAPASSLHNGGSWANAFQDLQSALAAAHPTSGSPVSIFVASGTYKPTTGTNQSASFVLKSYLSIMGGFRGTESNFNQRPNYGSPTVLSGDIGIPAAHPLDQNNIQTANIAFDPNDPGLQDNCYNVLYASNVTDILLDQIYVTGGYANVSTNVVDPTELISMAITPGPTNTSESFLGTTILPLDSRVAGGGLCLINPASAAPPSQVTLILNDCVFANNGARGYGGGVAVKFASVAVNGSTFANNFAGQEGGGYWGMNCFSDIYFCDFLTNVSYGDGGGLVYQSIPTDYTVDPFSASDESNRQTTEAIVGTSLDSAKFATKLYRAPSVDGSFVTKLRSLLPGNPFQAISAGASVSDQALEVGTRLSRSLSWITIAVTAVDVVADIVSAAGEGNSTFVKNWTWFSENFNNYATPQGWIYYLFDAIGLIRSPSATQLADQVKQQEEGVYNQAGYSSVVGCQFIGNSAAGEGGGYYCLYDNVQVEDCVFLRNGAQDAGAMANFAWTKPIIISCAFVENFGTAGQSAVVNAFHARAQYANCTFSYNVSGTAGYAMGNQLAADVTICNSIFWGNTNVLGTNFAAGADIFTSVHTNLDSGTLSNYNAGLSDGTFVDWVANCDVSWSDVQSLRQLPLGANLVEVVFPDGFSPSYYQLRDYLATWDQQLFQNDLDGLLDALGYTDTGEGFRTNILDPRKGNISIEPILINGYIPSRFSPVLNRGNVSRLTNGVISSLTDWDAERAPRFYGANVDMGAIEYNGGGDPFLIDGFPVPNGYLPNVMYVTPGGRGNQSGNDWADATGNLRAAMTNQDFEVWVAAGTYYPSANGDRTASFTLGTNVQVYGGFLGSETNFNDRNWVINPTVLSGDIGVHGNDADNSFHVIANTNIDALSILDGFTITKGRGTNGGGIYNIISHPFLTNCVFVDNQVTGEGGAIYSSGIEGSPLNNCSFISNSAGIAGGAIYLNSRTFIEDCIFVRNSSALGGAVCFSNAAYNYVYNSLFVSNWVAGGASAAGGAIESQQTGLTVFNSTFSLNYDALAGVAVPTGAAGIDFQSTDPSRNLFIENSIFWRNFVTNSLGLVGTEEEQQITTNSTNPYFITDTLIQGLSQFAGSTTSGNIDVDPLFANARGGDFSLVRYSPALDAGNPAGQSQIMPTDLAGNPRVANQSIDLGAYEYQGVPTKVSFQISVSRSCDDSGAVYSLQLLPLNGAVLPLTAFQWEVNKSDGAGFVNVSDGGVYSGTSTNILTITHPSLDMNGYRYVVATSSSNLQFTSQSGTIYVSPSRFYVNANATGVNTGLTWADAFTDLQSALAAAEPCSQIWVAEGTYYPSAIGDTSAAFRMRSDIGIYGGFSGVETNLSQRNWLANPTILSGNLGNPALTNDNSLNVIFNYGNQVGLDCGPTAVLDGFTVRDAVGSGMINFYASPTVRNCIFTSNSGSDGGAMRNFFSSSPLVGNCVFENNSSVNGGAVNCSQDANASFVNCLFANNNSSFEGGAIAVSLSDAHLINCTVVNNFSAISGGGIYSQSATVEFLNSILWGNSDQERIPTATSAQAFLDIGGVLNQTNSCVQGSTNIANGNMGFDPLFAGSAAENFRLTLHSPAIDAGGSALAAGYFTDLDGNNRIVNSAVDMGAYEFPLLPGSPVKIYQVPEPLTACGVAGNAVFSVTGTNGSAASFVWQVNKNDGLGFAPVVINASAGVVLSNSTSLLILSNISPVMNGYLYEASVGSTGFATPPALLTVQPAGIIYVNNQSHSGAGNGTSWANAFPNLQQAINSASSCSEIWVAQGTYSPASGSSGGAWFQLVSGVGVYGGFAGTETTRSQRNWTNHPVTVTGGIGGNALFNNVAQSAPIDASAVLDGFVLQASNGFAINNFRASPTIQNCSFTGNSQFAIFNRNGAPTISSCVFTNNSGFSIYNQQSSPVISSCVFGDNQTGSTGGAIYNWQSSPVIADCLFETNSASSGGAIYNDNLSFAQIDRCRFLGNSSTGNGGAIYNSPAAAPIIGNSVFDRNSSGFQGGAIADFGGGMRLAFCTVARNSASYSGAGLYFQGQTATVDSCIFWENFSIQNPDSTPVEKIQVDNSTGSLTISNSIVQGLASLTGPNNIPFDPLFTNLAGGNFQLTAFSPAINSGDTPGAAHEFSDAAGRPRVFGGVVDRGAYEFQSARAGTLNILGLPQSLTACVLTRAEFDIVTQAGDTNVFQWQMFSGSSFVSVPNSAPYVITVAGNTNSLVIPSVSLSMNGTVFRVVSVGSGYTSPPFTLTVTPATVIYVNGNASTSGSGSSWATALTNLQTAMLQGDVCSEIWVARGVYFPGIAPDGNPSLVMKKGLRVYGGFAGTETNLSQRNWTSNVVVLKGYTNAAVIENIGAQEVIDSSAVLDGFTIDGGNYSGNAVLNLNASPTFQNCIFVNGSPGIWNADGANPLILSCGFSNNTAGAIVNEQCAGVVSNCFFAANGGVGQVGGAIYNFDASPIILACQFANNSANEGSAISLDGNSSIVVKRSFFEGNSASAVGTVYCASSTALFADDLFAGNLANQGDAIFAVNSRVVLNNCTLTGNAAISSGGGVYNQGGSLAATNSIFWNNTDSTGSTEIAQVNNTGGIVSISHSIVTGLSSYAGNQNVGFDPLFQAPSGNNFTPASASPAIDAGINSAVASGDADLNGNARVVRSTVDIGAIEVQNPGATTVVDLAIEPASQATCPGGTVSFTVVGGANSGAQFMWQVDSGSGFSAIPNDGFEFVSANNNSASVTISNTPANFNYSYRFLISSAGYTSPSYQLLVLPRRIIYVNAAATGNGTGTNWANAFTSFAAALTSGDACSQVWVAAGHYAPTSGQPAEMKSGLEVYGGFAGTETNISQRNWPAHPTILSANAAASAIFNQGFAVPINRTAVLDGFVLTGNSGQPPIENQQASPTIRNCVFQSNVFYSIANANSSPLIYGCVFTNNGDVSINIQGGAPTITNCVFTANQADGGSAISSSIGAQTTILGCLFNGNSAVGQGGAIDNSGATIFVVNCVFNANSARGVGGAVANTSGGAAYFTNSVFYGGAAFGSSAIYNGATLTLVNCTVTGNSTESQGGAVSTYAGTTTLLNTILSQNTTALSPPSVEGEQVYSYAGLVSATNCLVQGLSLYAGHGNIGGDPLFLNPAAGNFQLSPSSPAINAGLNLLNSLSTDVAGQPRVQLGTIDMGAYESAAVSGSVIQLVATPTSQSVCASGVANFAVQSQTPKSFVWQYFDGVNWDAFTFNSGSGTWTGPALGAYHIVSNSTSSTLTVSGISSGMSEYQFRFVIPGSYTGSPLVLTISPSSIIYVRAGASSGGNGQSWGTAYKDLESALASVEGCRNEIWLAGGTYTPVQGSGAPIGFSLPAGVAIYGGFTGTETNRAQRDWRNNSTILTGQNNQTIVGIDGTAIPIGAETVFDGLVLQSATGAALSIINASPAINNCVFRNNSQGALLNSSSSIFQNCSFVANNSVNGAGLEAFSGNVSCLDCLFSNNTATANGGGLYLQTGNLNLANCLFVNNSASYGGGIDCASAGTCFIVNCTISGNSATGGGAGFQGSLASLSVANSILWNNSVNGVADEPAQLATTPGPVSVSYSCVEGLSLYAGNNNFGNDPLFENPEAGQFALQPCSPAINAGANGVVSGISTDIAGSPRVANGVVDLGAYEFQGAPSQAMEIVTQPVSINYCAGGSNYFVVSVLGAGLNYQWLGDNNDGNGFVPLTDSSLFSGTASPILSINSASSAENGMVFQCAITSGAGCSLISSVATLTYPSTRWYVNAAVAGGNGSSWAQAFRTLDQALNAPFQVCNNEIWVAQGTYVPPAGGYAMSDNVALYGGFSGAETNLMQRNWNAFHTILDGHQSVSALIQNVNDSAPISPLARLDGFTLQNATSYAIYNHVGGSPTLANCIFRSNGVTAVYNYNATPLITNCTFLQNGSIGNTSGGAIYDYEPAGPFLVENCIFQGNISGTDGGAIYDEFGALTLVNCLFSGNCAADFGGAVGAGGEGGSVVVRNCTFSGNQSGFPGAAVDFGVPCLVYNSIFWNNFTPYGTAIQHTNEDAQVTIFNDGTPRVFNTCIEGLTVVGGQFSGQGNTGGNPDFVQNIDGSTAPLVGGDFHVTSCSSVIDAGSNSQVTLSIDLDGNPRILGSKVDLGAYEGAGATAYFVSQPLNRSAALSNTVQFVAVASKTNLTYQWQFQKTTNGTFLNLTNDAQYSGVTTAALIIGHAVSALDNYKFRCVIVDQCSTILSTAAAFHFLYAPPLVYNVGATNYEGFAAMGQFQAVDPQGLPLTYGILTQPKNGLVDLSGAPNFQYIATNPRFFGSDSFTYYASNGFTNSVPATVFVTLVKVEQNPSANNLTLAVPENTSGSVTLTGSDYNGDALTFFVAVPPQHGALNVIGSNAFYMPATNYSGLDIFIYQSSNGIYASGSATVSISVNHFNRPAVARPDGATIYSGQSVVIPVLQNDVDLDNNPLSVVGVTQGTNGSVTFTSSNVTYIHNGSITTNDHFSYSISDGQGNIVAGAISMVILQPGTSFLVTNTADSGPGSLRSAIAGANTVASLPYQIIFSPALAGKTIALSTTGENAFGAAALVLSNNVSIDAKNAPGLIVARDPSSSPMRLFHLIGGAHGAFRNIVLTNGFALGAAGNVGIDGEGAGGGAGGFGGAIYSEGSLSLSNVTLSGNLASGGIGGTSAGGGSPSGGNGGGVNGGVGAGSAGGFGGGGAGASAGTQTPGGAGGFGAGQGGGASSGAQTGGVGGFGAGGGSGGGSQFSGGGGAGFGGAVFVRDGTFTASNCVFSGNAVSGGAAGNGPAPNYQGFPGQGFGGGVFNYNGTAILSACVFVNNRADVCDGLYNIGDAAIAAATVLQSSFTNLTGLTNFFQSVINGGSASGLSDNLSSFSENQPFIQAISNQTTVGPLTFGFTISPPVSSSFNVTAASSNPALIPAAGVMLGGSGQDRSLTLSPAFGASGVDNVTVQVIDGNLSMSQVFPVNISRNLSVFAPLGGSVTIPIFAASSGWAVTGVGLAASGSVIFNSTSITYSNSAAFTTSDGFTYQISNGSSTAAGSVAITILTNVVPFAVSQSVTAFTNAPVNITLSGSDLYNDPVTFALGAQPQHGVLSGSPPNLIYTPANNFTGPDSFKFHVNNRFTNSADATVSIAVREIFGAAVTTAGDSGPGSLRAALSQANADSFNLWRISFAAGLPGHGILLSSIGDNGFGASALVVSNLLVIDGGSAGSTIACDPNGSVMRLLRVATNAQLTLLNLTLTNGQALGGNGGDGAGGGGGGAGMGGAVYNEGSLTVSNVVLTKNRAAGGSGGHYSTGGQPDYLVAGGAGGGVNGGTGQEAASGVGGTFGGGGAGGGSTISGFGSGGGSGFGAINGGSYPVGPYTVFGGAGGFGGGGGGGWICGGGGGAGMGGAIFNHGGAVTISASIFSNNMVSGGHGYIFNNAQGAGGSGFGGAVFNYNGIVTISNSVMTQNSATNGGAIYSIGDGATARLTLQGAVLTNNAPLDFVQNEINNGFAAATAHGDIITQGSPWLQDIADQTASGAATLPLMLSAPITSASNRVVSVASDNPSFLGSSNFFVTLANTTGSLTVSPPAIPGTANIDLTLTDGSLSYSDTFKFTVSYNLTAVVNAGQSVTLQVFPANSQLSIIGVSQGVNGSVTFTPRTLTYNQTGPSGAGDSFTYTFSDGAHNFVGNVTITIQRSTVTINSTADDGPGSLRAAIALANGAPGVSWRLALAPSLAGQTILMGTVGDNTFGPSALAIAGTVTLDGSAAPGAALSRNANGPVMRLVIIEPTGTLTLNNLALQNGLAQGASGGDGESTGGGGAGFGGAILNTGSLVASNVVFALNQAIGGNGGDVVALGDAGNGGGPSGGIGGLPSGDDGLNGGFGSGGGGGMLTNEFGNGSSGGFGAGEGGGTNGVNFGGTGGFGGGGGGGLGGGGGGGLGAGAAIFNGGSASFVQCLFTSNTVTSGAGGTGYMSPSLAGTPGNAFGGALFNYNGQLSISNSTFSGNSASNGGGIYLLADDTTNEIFLSGVTANDLKGRVDLVTTALDGGSLEILTSSNSFSSEASPSIGAIANVTTNRAFSVAVPASAPTGVGSYSIEAISLNSTLIPNSNLVVTGTGSNAVLTVTPAVGQTGSSMIGVVVTDTGVSVGVMFQVTITSTLAAPTTLGASLQSGGGLHIHFQGAADSTYGIQVSTNLVKWLPVGPATQTSSGVYDFVDTNTVGFKSRFYRVDQTP